MFAAMAEVDRVLGNDDKLSGEAWRATRAAFDAEPLHRRQDRGRRHHGGARDGAASGRGLPARLPRVFVQVQNGCDHRCTFCIIPFGRGTVALAAGRRGGRAGPRAGRARPCRDRADRRRSHQLRRRSARRADARRAGQDRSCATCRSCSGCGCRRSIRSRPTAICSMRSPMTTAADAASASVAAIRRRSDPEADEAAAQPRRRDRVLRRAAPAAARTSCSAPISSPAFRPRPTRCFARSLDLVEDCGLTLAARVSLFAAPRHAGGADAAARRPRHQGTREAAARRGRGGVAAAARCRDRHTRAGADRKRDARPHRAFPAGGDRRRNAGRR